MLKDFFAEKGAAFIASQIISIIAAAFLLLSFQQRTHRRIVAMQAISGLLFATQYFLLGAYEGMICNLIGMFRACTYYFRGKFKFVDSVLCPCFFALAFVISGIFTYKNPFSLMPMGAMIIASFVMWSPRTQRLRALTLPSSVMWLIYNAACSSYVACLTEFLCEVSIIIGLIRFREKRTRK